MQEHVWVVEIRTHRYAGWVPWTVHALRSEARSERRHISGESRIRKFVAA